MALVTPARYKVITGDTVTSDGEITARIEEATTRLEEKLDRPLVAMSRAEPMYPDQHGRVYPHAIPIQSAPGYTVDGVSLVGVWWPAPLVNFVGIETAPVITYTGGFIERSANPNAPNRLPQCIEDDIAWAAWALLHPSAAIATQIPAGATSVSLGDASIGFGPEGAKPSSRSGIRWSPETLAYRYRRLGAI